MSNHSTYVEITCPGGNGAGSGTCSIGLLGPHWAVGVCYPVHLRGSQILLVPIVSWNPWNYFRRRGRFRPAVPKFVHVYSQLRFRGLSSTGLHVSVHNDTDRHSTLCKSPNVVESHLTLCGITQRHVESPIEIREG